MDGKSKKKKNEEENGFSLVNIKQAMNKIIANWDK